MPWQRGCVIAASHSIFPFNASTHIDNSRNNVWHTTIWTRLRYFESISSFVYFTHSCVVCFPSWDETFTTASVKCTFVYIWSKNVVFYIYDTSEGMEESIKWISSFCSTIATNCASIDCSTLKYPIVNCHLSVKTTTIPTVCVCVYLVAYITLKVYLCIKFVEKHWFTAGDSWGKPVFDVEENRRDLWTFPPTSICIPSRYPNHSLISNTLWIASPSIYRRCNYKK